MTEVADIPYASNQRPQLDPSQDANSTSLHSLCTTIHNRITAFLSEEVQTETLRNTQRQTHHSLSIISTALERYPHPTLSLSYNGGKDCLLLLTLYLSLLPTSQTKLPKQQTSIPAIYIPPPHPFPAVDTFVVSTAHTYNLDLALSSASSMKEAFRLYLEGQGKGIEAIFVGTRRTDPHGKDLGDFQRTDGGWPGFMRVHPMLEWRYAEVWAFLRHLDIPYCELYDQGYTSLGGTNDTHPNPALRVVDQDGSVRFRPAHEMTEDSEERLGRDW